MNEQVTGAMFALCRYVICGVDLTEEDKAKITPERLPQLYAFSKLHDMVHIVAQGLSKLDFLGEDEISKKFQKQQMLAVYRYQNLNHALEQIAKTLEDAMIPFIPLKGSVIRQYYPEPWMRTSCDIDILIHKEDLDKVTSLLSVKLQYKSNFVSSHDVSMYSPTGIHAEIHFDLIEEDHMGKADILLKNVWNYATVAQGSIYRHIVRNDFFYFYHLAHMAKHIISGGCGIRPLLDLYILNHSVDFHQAIEYDIIKEGNLRQLAEESTKLSEFWFGQERKINKTCQILQEYILQSGTYGILSNATTVQQALKQDPCSKKRILKKFWKPYEELKYWYPILMEHRWLTPIFQMKRWFRILFGGTMSRMISNKKVAQRISENRIFDTKQMLHSLGLDQHRRNTGDGSVRSPNCTRWGI